VGERRVGPLEQEVWIAGMHPHDGYADARLHIQRHAIEHDRSFEAR